MVPATLLFLNLSLSPMQESHATVEGWVSDSSGRAAVGAQVILQLEKCDCAACPDAGCSCCAGLLLTVTNGQGYYSLITNPGTYSLRAKWPSANAIQIWSLRLTSGKPLRRDFIISVQP